MVSFLFKAHRNYAAQAARPKRVEYVDNQRFNAFVDETHEPIDILSLTYRPSEVLYNVDYEAYVDALNSFSNEQDEGASADEPPEVSA